MPPRCASNSDSSAITGRPFTDVRLRATSINRELLDGAAALAESDEEILEILDDVWDSASRRAIMIAAGRDRATDFSPATAARAYALLYRDVVRGSRQ